MTDIQIQNEQQNQNNDLAHFHLNQQGSMEELIVYFMGLIIIPSIMVGYLVYHSFGYI